MLRNILSEEKVLLALQFTYTLVVLALFVFFMVSSKELPTDLKTHTYVVVAFLFGKEVLATIRSKINGGPSLISHKDKE